MRPAIYPFGQGGAEDKDGADVEVGAADLGNMGGGLSEGGAITSDQPSEDTGVDASPETPAPGGKPRKGRGRAGSNEPFEITADRPIFTLSVAADLLGLHPRTLRIYEEKKLVVPSRTDGNRRRYSQRDVQRVQSIRHLTGGRVNLEGIRIILELAEELTRLGGDPMAIIERNLPAPDER